MKLKRLIRLEKMKTDFKARRLHESSELRLSRLVKARSVRQTNRPGGIIADSIRRFRDSIKIGPYFVCVICNRMLYRVSQNIKQESNLLLYNIFSLMLNHLIILNISVTSAMLKQ